ncbi:MAG: hypothetical protein V2I67_09060 [Thermoanaerobaculales bacterium]|nr:hypothetical protein [Thermoanaerobaculales bacterium]
MSRTTVLNSTAAAALVLAIALTAPVSADDGTEIHIKARAVSSTNIIRAASDLVDIRIERWSTDDEREELVQILSTEGNRALASALDEKDETGWVSFDPRGGGGPGRDPRRSYFKYAREIAHAEGREIILITNQYPGYGQTPQAANGAKLANYPVSFVLLKLRENDAGETTGIGRMFVGAKLRYDIASKKFVIDEFPMDPVYLKDVKVKVK